MDEIFAPVWNHFLERIALLFCVGFGGEVICMMSVYENGLCKIYGENGFPLL